jgi:hypothetical protein
VHRLPGRISGLGGGGNRGWGSSTRFSSGLGLQVVDVMTRVVGVMKKDVFVCSLIVDIATMAVDVVNGFCCGFLGCCRRFWCF